MRRVLLCLVFLGGVVHTPAIANTYALSAVALKAFDQLCVSTLLNDARFKANAALFNAVEIGKDQLALMSDATLGFMLTVEKRRVVASWGMTRARDVHSRNCTVTIPELPLQEARTMLESKFRVTLRDQFRQGESEVVLYSASLAGFVKDTAISIQHSRSAALTSISLFEAE